MLPLPPNHRSPRRPHGSPCPADARPDHLPRTSTGPRSTASLLPAAMWSTGLATCLALTLAPVLTGCHAPTVPDRSAQNALPSDLALPSQWQTGQDADAATPQARLGFWWQAFEDPTLNALVDAALAQNFNLRSAFNRIDQARALAVQAGSDQALQLNGTAGGSQTFSKTGGNSRNQTTWSLGLQASYEVDLWDRLKHTTTAAEIDVLASEQAMQTAAVALSGQVANAYFRWQVAQGQLALINRQLENNQNVYKLLDGRFKQGNAQAADVLSQQQLLASTQSQWLEAQATVAQIENELAVLLGNPSTAPTLQQLLDPARLVPANAPETPTGNTPSATTAASDDQLAARSRPWELSDGHLKLPPLPDTGLPTALLERRPDIVQAFQNIQAADARTAAAIANQYPRLALSASLTTSDNDLRDVLDNWAANLAANLTAPLLDGGNRKAQVALRQAQLEEAVNAYAQTVVEAVVEVQDALTQERWLLAQIEQLDERLDLSKRVLQARRNSFINGASTYLDVLDALDNDQALARTRLTAQQNLLTNRVTLHRALAGGFMPVALKETQPAAETTAPETNTTETTPTETDAPQR